MVCCILMGCSDSGPGILSGTLSFSYSGAGAVGTGTYNASGSLPFDFFAGPSDKSWAAGFVANQSNTVSLAASLPRANAKWDMVAMTIPTKTVGTPTISANCTADTCTSLALTVGTSADESSFDMTCVLTTGSITISAISKRAQGSFSGSGSCTDQSAGITPFSVSNGTFDVPVVEISVSIDRRFGIRRRLNTTN